MNKKEQMLAERVRDAIDQIWCEYYTEENINSGDITPHEAIWYDRHINNVAQLIYQVGENNRKTYVKKYYIEMYWHPSNGEDYVLQSQWFDAEEEAIQWATQISWVSENFDVCLMSAEWDIDDGTYGDIIQERVLEI